MTQYRGIRRLSFALTYILGPALLIGVLILLLTNSLQVNVYLGSIASALIVLSTVFVNIVRYLRREKPPLNPDEAAKQLVAALREQWEPEMRYRKERFGDSRTIPLTWVQVDPQLADASVRHKLNGRLDENIDQAAEKLARSFMQPSGRRRLVLLGEPGAGKTFLAITLTVGLLRQWAVGERVPVFLSLSSWDPVVETLDDWMVREIASVYYGGRKQTPRTLLYLRQLLPVLDGLDELPEHVRRMAITRINDTLDGDRSLVLTCRTAEYQDGIAGGAPVLMRAVVFQVQPLSTNDIAVHLSGRSAWGDVVRQVRLQPDSPLATALSTPLMLSLFTAVYVNRSPAELLGNDKLSTRHAVEDHLVDALLDSAYPADSAQDSWWSRRWTSKQARRWLTFLAEHLHEEGVRDLSSGQLAHSVIPAVSMTAIGLAAIVVLSSLAPAAFRLIGLEPHTVSDVPLLSVVILGIASASLVLASKRRLPGRVPLAADRNWEGFGFGMLAGTLGVLFAGLLDASPDLLSIGSDRTYNEVVRWSANVSAVVAMSLVIGLGVGLHESRVAHMFVKRGARAGITDFLRRDRASALRTALGTGLVVGISIFFSATIAAALGGHLGQRVALIFGLPTIADLHLPSLRTHVPWEPPPEGMTTLVEMSVLLAMMFGLAMLSTRTWARFLVARVTLATLRKLPWRVERFLADARDRGVLRGAGGYYQFGHVRLQERLIATAVADRSRKSRRVWRLASVGVAAAVVLTGTALVVAEEPSGCRDTGWASVDHRMVRTVNGEDSGCFAYLTPNEWGVLGKTQGDAATLAKIGSVRAVQDKGVIPNDYAYVFIVGEFDHVEPGRWHDILDGVAAAQRVHNKEPIEIGFIFADTLPATQDTEAASLTSSYMVAAIQRLFPNPRAGNMKKLAAINVDVAPSLPVAQEHVVGLRAATARTLGTVGAEYARLLVSGWLAPDERVRTSTVNGGISDEECSEITEARRNDVALSFDLRGVDGQMQLVDRIDHCGGALVLVDRATAKTLRAHSEGLPRTNVVYLEDESATMEHDCETVLNKETQPQAVASCVATLAAADSFRVAIRDAWTS